MAKLKFPIAQPLLNELSPLRHSESALEGGVLWCRYVAM